MIHRGLSPEKGNQCLFVITHSNITRKVVQIPDLPGPSAHAGVYTPHLQTTAPPPLILILSLLCITPNVRPSAASLYPLPTQNSLRRLARLALQPIGSRFLNSSSSFPISCMRSLFPPTAP